MTGAVPRRLCPACTRRYGALVDRDCPLCIGLGVLPLGAAALHHYPAPTVARAVELYLEHHAARAVGTLPPGDARRAFLEAAADDLRHAGILTGAQDTARTTAHVDPPDNPTATSATEHAARAYTADLGAPTTTTQLAALAAPPAGSLTEVKPRTGLPTGSANGHRAALATIADELDALGPDATELDEVRIAQDRRARVIAIAAAEAADKHRRRRRGAHQ